MTLTKRQARTLMALCVAVILTQILCTAVLIRNLERTRKEAEAAQVSAMDVLEMQKQAESKPRPAVETGKAFEDVKLDHWAYQAVTDNDIRNVGHLSATPHTETGGR